MKFWLVLETGDQLLQSYNNILKDFGFFQMVFLKIIFLHGEIFEFCVILLFALRRHFFNVNGKATLCDTPVV